jgi:hypothetical protein
MYPGQHEGTKHVTTTESDLRAEAVDLIRHIAEAIYNADTGGMSRYNAPVWMFADADTIERYTRMAAAARRVFEADVERRLDHALDVEGTARFEDDEIRSRLTLLFALVTDRADRDDDDVDHVLRVTMRDLADLIEFDHAGWFDVPASGPG